MFIDRTIQTQPRESALLNPMAMHTCQSCGEQDEFLMTFENQNTKTRWLCSSCYWEAIARHAYHGSHQSA